MKLPDRRPGWRRRPRRREPGLALAVALAFSLCAPLVGHAGSGAEPDEEALAFPLRPDATERSHARPPAWMGEHMHYKKGAGFEYRRALRLGDLPLEVGFQGPVVRKKKRLGLTVEVRF